MINFRLIFLALAAVLLFNFFNHGEEEFDGTIVLPLDTKVLAFGDSITNGYNVDSEKSYPSQLSKLLQTEVINEGRNGELSSEGVKRLPALLEKHKPQILLICHGGNDIIKRRSLIKAKENIASMIKIARKKNIQVILVGVPKLEIVTITTAEIYYELSQELNVPLDTTLEEILNDNNLKLDQIHPNEKGYKVLANNLAELTTATYIPSQLF